MIDNDNIIKRDPNINEIDILMRESSLLREEIDKITNINSQRDIELRISLTHMHKKLNKKIENSIYWLCINLDNKQLLKHLRLYGYLYRYAPIFIEYLSDPNKNPKFIDASGVEPVRKNLVDLC